MQKFLILAALTPWSSLALAGEKVDIDVGIAAANGRLITGASIDGAFTPERVFGAELGEVVPNLTDEPGFEADDGALTPNTFLGFRVLDALRVWNGADFSPVSDSTMTLSFLTLETTTPDNPGEVVDGFNFLLDDEGGMHNHPAYQLNSPANTGVYLLQLRFTGGGFADSLPFFIVFNQNEPESVHDDAIRYAREYLVPAPGATSVLVCAGLACARRRR